MGMRLTVLMVIVLVVAALVGLTRWTGDAEPAPVSSLIRRQVLSGPVSVTTPDGVLLDGMYRAGGSRSDIGLLFVHGFTATFDAGPVAILAASLADRGYATLALNMRDAGCCTYTTLFEDNAIDVDVGVRFLKEAGASRIVVLGHSLGANRMTYYRAQIDDAAVRAMVLLSAVGNVYRVASAFDVQGTGARALDEANRRLAEGDGLDDLLEVPLGTYGTYYYTPASLVSNGGPDTNSDFFKWLPAISLPLLFVQATNDAFLPFQRPELAQQTAVRSPRADLTYIAGADHSFTGHEDELSDVVETWLGQVLP